jgi:hypothetical protein
MSEIAPGAVPPMDPRGRRQSTNWHMKHSHALTPGQRAADLLNLFLSVLAGLQGAILLIAAKRQDAIGAALAQHDFETDANAKQEIEELMRVNRRQLVLIGQLVAERGAPHPTSR